MSDFMAKLKNRPVDRTYTVSGTLMSISKSVHGMYRLVECKNKTVTDDELAELEAMARRAEKIYQRVKEEKRYER